MQSYKNLTNQPLIIPNVGEVPPNGTLDTEVELCSPHLQCITAQKPEPPVVQSAPEPKGDE